MTHRDGQAADGLLNNSLLLQLATLTGTLISQVSVCLSVCLSVCVDVPKVNKVKYQLLGALPEWV